MALPRIALVLAACAALLFPACAQTDPGSSLGFRKVGSWPGYSRGTPADLVIEGDFAYVAMGEGGLCIVDVSSRSAPVVVGRLDLPGSASRIELFGGYAYLSCGSAGLQVVDVSNPATPSLSGSLDTAGTALGCGVAYPYAFIADGANGVVIADISNPGAPVAATQIQLPGTVYDLQAELVITLDINSQPTMTNRYLQVVNGTNGFLAYRVTDPFAPQLQQHDVGPLWDARAITRVGRDVYWTERNYISRFNFTRIGQNPVIIVDNNLPVNVAVTKLSVSRLPASGLVNFDLFGGSLHYNGVFFGGSDLHVSQVSRIQTAVSEPGDGYRYLLDNDKGLMIYKDGGLVSATAIGGETSKLKLVGDLLYAADGQAGLQILNVSSDGGLSAVGQYVDEWAPDSFDVIGSNVFGWFGDTNFSIVDASGPAQAVRLTNAAPMLFSNLSVLAGRDVAVQDGFAFVASVNELWALDVADPAKPVRAGHLTVTSSVVINSICVSGANLFAADRVGLLSFAINPDKSFTLLQRLNTTSRTGRRITLVGTTAYICERAGGVKIYDVFDPANMREIGSYATPGNALSAAVSGSFAYIADQQNGILVLDISNPSNPGLVTTLPLSNSPFDIVVRGNRIFVAHGAEGVSVWDLVPRKSQTIDFPSIADKTAIDAPFTPVATASSGLPVQFEIVSGPASVENGLVTLTGSGLVTIRAIQPGNDEFAAIFADRTFNVIKATQTIDFPPIPDKTTFSAPFQITAIANSGLPVRIVSFSEGAYVGQNGYATNTGIVTIVSAGTVIIRAIQDGDNKWLPVTVERTFTITEPARPPQTITMPTPLVASIDDDPFALPVSASSGLPVTVNVSGPATLQDGIMKITGLGTVTVTANQAGNVEFAPVTLVRMFEVYDLPAAATANVLARNPSLPAGDAAPEADADHDGVPNIVEFILNSDPTSATSMDGHITASFFEAGGARYFKAHYFKPRTMRYPVGVQVAEFARYPILSWLSLPAGFNEDGVGDFSFAVTGYTFPLIRFVIQYP